MICGQLSVTKIGLLKSIRSESIKDVIMDDQKAFIYKKKVVVVVAAHTSVFVLFLFSDSIQSGSASKFSLKKYAICMRCVHNESGVR